MNELLDDDDARLSPRGERELTLSTGAILGIFFALVLICGACFGLGYNMGRKSLPTPLAINDSSSDSLSAADAGEAAKPAAGSAIDNTPAAPAPVVAAPPPTRKPAPVVRRPPTVEPTAATNEAAPAPATVHLPAATATPAVHAVSPSALMPGAASQGTGSIMVQVAAVSHQEDADLLLGALRSRGYTVTARPGASDGFIHVQVGPFGNKKDAEAMRQRLIADGYNAILK